MLLRLTMQSFFEVVCCVKVKILNVQEGLRIEGSQSAPMSAHSAKVEL